ncbi:MAG: CopG family transcriptional regulator [Pseudomonadota bacterium]|jgi:hypothetical protein
MGQVTIYLDPETESKMLNMIKKSGISKSKWIAELIRDKTANAWPENVKKLAGAWEDLPTAEKIREDMANDAERESI